MMVACAHTNVKKFGKNRNGTQRVRCLQCGATVTIDKPAPQPKPLGAMRVAVDDAKLVLRLLTEGMSIRATARTTGIEKKTIIKPMVHFGTACRDFLDARMQNLNLEHLQFDGQWTFVFTNQSRLTVDQRETCYDQGDIYTWTCIDQRTKLMPSFRLGKRTGDNARRFMQDVAGRLTWPNPQAEQERPAAPHSRRHGRPGRSYLDVRRVVCGRAGVNQLPVVNKRNLAAGKWDAWNFFQHLLNPLLPIHRLLPSRPLFA